MEQDVSKKVRDPERNQLILLHGLEEETGNSDVLLDGHFVLLDSEGRMRYTPVSFFEKIPLRSIVVLKDRPTRIAKRLYARDGTGYRPEFLAELQENEIRQGHRVSVLLGVPELILDMEVTPEPEKELALFLERSFCP